MSDVSNVIHERSAADHLAPESSGRNRGFPKEARTRIGKGRFRLQSGDKLTMPIARPMPVVGSGVSELRVRGEDGIYRVFYFAATRRVCWCFTLFEKKTQRTPPLEIEMAKKRVKELLDA